MNQFRGRKTQQIAYFVKKYNGHIHNPGMGIISMALSDHMVTGYTIEDRIKADAQPPFDLTREMLQKVTKLPYIDNIYIYELVGMMFRKKLESFQYLRPLKWLLKKQKRQEKAGDLELCTARLVIH